MGLDSRDYVRDAPPPGGYGGGYGFSPASGLWAVKYLLIANIAVFVLQKTTGALQRGQIMGGVTEWLSLSLHNLVNEDPTQAFQIWRIVTYGFCHGSFGHIFFNLFVLWMFGRNIEPIYGSREFLYFYLAGVVVSGLCHVGVQAAMGLPAGVIGASGGVMSVVFLTAMVFPRHTVLLFFVIPMPLYVMAIIYAAIDVFGALHPGGASVAHWAHLGGAAFGVAYKHFEWRFSGLFTGFRNPLKRLKRRPTVKLHRPPPEPDHGSLESRVDALLQKISEKGEASLTEEEREFLYDASRRYRK